MTKTEAIEALGGTRVKVAEAIGISPQAVSDWPELLTAAIEDRVLAALWRRSQPGKTATEERQAKVA